MSMDFDAYAAWTARTWKSIENTSDGRLHAILGLAGEVGEVVEKVKKAHRGDLGEQGLGGVDQLQKRPELAKELGDVIYYWARCCVEFGFNPSDVVRDNVAKLEDRLKRDVLRGSGDNR